MDDKTLKSDISWLKAHERIIAIFLALVLVGWLGNHYLNNSADTAHTRAILAEQQLQQQKDANAQKDQQNQQIQAQYQQMMAQYQQQNAQLATAAAARSQTLVKQQQVDQTMPVDDLVVRWATMVDTQGIGYQLPYKGVVNVSEDAARKTVIALEKGPVLEANLKDQTTIADNRQAQLSKANELVTGLNGEITGLKAQSQQQDATCKAEKKDLQAQARKSKGKWFAAGVVVGWVAAHFK